MTIESKYCSTCYKSFHGTSRAIYCSNSCKQKAFKTKGNNRLYIARFDGVVKVGVSKDVDKRINSLNSILGRADVVKSFVCHDAYLVEGLIKTALSKYHKETEAIKTELFTCTIDTLESVAIDKLRNPKVRKIKFSSEDDASALLETSRLTVEGIRCSQIGHELSDLVFDICSELSIKNPSLSSEISKLPDGQRLIYSILWKNTELSYQLLEAVSELEAIKDKIQLKLDLM